MKVNPMRTVTIATAIKVILILVVLSSGDLMARSVDMQSLPEGIEVTLSVPKTQVRWSDSVELRVGFRNVSQQAITFLKWATPFDGAVQFDMLEVALEGKRLPYVGRIIRRAPPNDNDYITLNSGQSIEVIVDIEQAYGVYAPGKYQIRYRSSNEDLAVGNAASLTLIDNRFRATLKRQAPAFNGCSVSQQAILVNDIDVAEAAAQRAYQGLQQLSVEQRATSPRYLRWFGTYSPARFQEVLDTLGKTYFALRDQQIGLECNSSCGDLASVFPNDEFNIQLCPPYFSQPSVAASSDPDSSRSGTLIHELTHFTSVGNTQDYAYFTTASLALARNNPARAVDNADNYYFFVENVFPPLPISTLRNLSVVPAIIILLDE